MNISTEALSDIAHSRAHQHILVHVSTFLCMPACTFSFSYTSARSCVRWSTRSCARIYICFLQCQSYLKQGIRCLQSSTERLFCKRDKEVATWPYWCGIRVEPFSWFILICALPAVCDKFIEYCNGSILVEDLVLRKYRASNTGIKLQTCRCFIFM